MLPFSLKEFIEINNLGDNLERDYRQYIETTSFPYVHNLSQAGDQISQYLRSIYNSVVLKDIIQRRNISDVMMLERIFRFLSDNNGGLLSTKKISDTMNSFGRSINVRTVESYIDAFLESYVIYQAKRYDVKGKQYLKTLEKYFIVDIGLRNEILGADHARDIGHILENVIYLELIRRGYDYFCWES